MRFLNIHSHHAAKGEEICIQNIYRDFDKPPLNEWYSAGLHPWYIHADWENSFSVIKELCRRNNVVAVGETGLDKLCYTDFAVQQQVFIEHIKLANKLKKPLIIHCVKAFNEVSALLKEYNNGSNVIFHGYNRNISIAQQLVQKGYYLSFGEALQKQTIQEVIKAVPLTQLFFETDDSAITIQQVYSLASTALSIDENSLLLHIQKNAQQIFGAALNSVL